MTIRIAAVLLSSVLGLAPVAHAQLAASPAPQPAPRHFLWEVSSLTNKVYLFGTIHAGKKTFYPLPAAVREAFDEAKVIAVEADITDAATMAKSGASMTLQPPDTLSKHVPGPLYERFLRQLARTTGMAEKDVAQLKPFFAASLLSFGEWGRQGYTQQYGVDLQLILRAKSEKKRLVELEGVQAQAALMGSLTEKEQLQAFEGAVVALESGAAREQITGLVNAWQAGDPGQLLAIMKTYNEATPGARELEEKFIWSRHEAMAKKVEDWLLAGRERVFVAVGALHLAGPRGLVEILKGRGYMVRQL